MPHKKKEHLFKILIIGDSSSGKTSLLNRIADDNFIQNVHATIGIDFKSYTCEIDEQIIKLQLWDTAGQEKFRTISPLLYRGVHGIFIVFDVTDILSFYDLSRHYVI